VLSLGVAAEAKCRKINEVEPSRSKKNILEYPKLDSMNVFSPFGK